MVVVVKEEGGRRKEQWRADSPCKYGQCNHDGGTGFETRSGIVRVGYVLWAEDSKLVRGVRCHRFVL